MSAILSARGQKMARRGFWSVLHASSEIGVPNPHGFSPLLAERKGCDYKELWSRTERNILIFEKQWRYNM